MTFPAGFNVASAKLLQVQGIGTGSMSALGQTVKYTLPSAVSVPANAVIKISIADISNAATTSNQVAVTTTAISGPNVVVLDGPTNSAVFTLIQASNAMIGTSAITAPKMAANSIDNTKIQDGQVTTADLAANSVDSSKIKDGTIGKSDITTAFVKKVTIPDLNDPSGWNPDERREYFGVSDTALKDDSVITINFFPNTGLVAECSGKPGIGADGLHTDGRIFIDCNYPPHEGTILTYVLIN
jgi:hypothetical protein